MVDAITQGPWALSPKAQCRSNSLMEPPAPSSPASALMFSCLPSAHTGFKYSHLTSSYFQWDPGASSAGSTFVRNAECHAPPQTLRVQICISTRCPGDLHVCLRSTGLTHECHSSAQALSVAPCVLKDTIQMQPFHPRLPAQPLLS
uniref:Uncharacterized protein n=1 Tax=Pipistrellus kuhlii TaxID=59472 RepID=A0A7J7W2Z6_PIPKU|nr:hypothetical protein mPipKuh1_008143 [Pipistrellus kuhlii]